MQKPKTITHAARPTSLVRDYVELTKPRIVVMVVLTAVAGLYLGTQGPMDLGLLLHTMVGTGLVVASANTLNQLLERDVDAKMRRTMNRPLPAGRMDGQEVLLSGIGMVVLGFLDLVVAVNAVTALLAFAAWIIYLFFYTPLKRRSSVSTLVGAISGAIPPVIGWAAVRGQLTIEALPLFLVLFFWQLPHFLAIAWMYREDYARGGFPMLPVIDPDGSRTGRQIVKYGLALVPISLLPTVIGISGGFYFIGALVLSVVFLGYGVRTALRPSTARAKQLLLASLVYLPVLMGLMMIDKRPL